jgi:hypothetical protein
MIVVEQLCGIGAAEVVRMGDKVSHERAWARSHNIQMTPHVLEKGF